MLKIATAIMACTMFMPAANADEIMKKKAMESKVAIKEFMTQLQGELQGAMKAGGPLHAVDVCNKTAPLIAKNLSDKYGWEVSRTSLKVRNTSNQADEWEAKVLASFEDRKAKGEDVKSMAFSEVVEANGIKQFRFMKAIPTGEVCLKCHGEKLPVALRDKINEVYPADKAVDFKLGDIRGAFSITQPW